MNERIGQLLSQCTQESIDGLYATPYVDQQKFAELIIKECIKIAHIMSDVSTETAMAIENQIKEYFYQ